MSRVRSLAWTFFVFVAVLVVLFGVFPGTWFDDDDASERDAQWLVTSYAAVLTAAMRPHCIQTR
jgi:hypothetical protein